MALAFRGRAFANLARCAWLLDSCKASRWAVSGVPLTSLVDDKTHFIHREKFGKSGNCARTGVTWALQPGKRHQEQTGSVVLAGDDFVFKENFGEGPFLAFKEGRLRGLYRKDGRQEIVILKMQDLFSSLRKSIKKRHKRSGLTVVENLGAQPEPPAWWNGIARLMHDSSSSSPRVNGEVHPQCYKGSKSAKGLYMYGGVGVGKTMLMDLFVVSAPPEYRVHRTHFHDFMLDVHSRLKQHANQEDPLVHVADSIASTCRVLALDEFFVTDVADAMILHRLFDRLWDKGVVLIATSNRKPDDLYEGGLQRDLFLPFIAKLKENCDAHNMESTVDYRKLAHHQSGLYFEGDGADSEVQAAFQDMSADHTLLKNVPVEVKMGRVIDVPKAAGPVAYFTFQELCGRPVGAADYIALVHRFHTVCLEGVPVIMGANRSEAYRLVMLIDVLYDHRVRFACSAEAGPSELFANIITQSQMPAGPGDADDSVDYIVDNNLGFAKERTISRLTEMQSLEYIVEHANRHAPEHLLALAEAQAKQGRQT